MIAGIVIRANILLVYDLNNDVLQGLCQSDFILNDLLQDIFMGNELIPDVIDKPPRYPLEVSYKTIRTFPGMRLTADLTRFKPMLKWPAQPDTLYTVVMSNLDINSRRNRSVVIVLILFSTFTISEHCQSSGTGLLRIFLETLLMMVRWSLSCCSPWFCLKEMEIIDMDSLCLNSLDNWTIKKKEVQQTPAVLRCPMEEDLSNQPRTSWRNMDWTWQQLPSSFLTPTKLAWRWEKYLNTQKYFINHLKIF